MSSDAVINQIIKAIIQSSSSILKERETAAIAAKTASTLPVSSKLSPDKDTIHDLNSEVEEYKETDQDAPRSLNELFQSGIESLLKPYQVTETLSAFILRSVVLNPMYGFNAEKEMSRADVERLIEVYL